MCDLCDQTSEGQSCCEALIWETNSDVVPTISLFFFFSRSALVSEQIQHSYVCISLQKLRDIFALEVRKMHMSFYGTPSTPCRKPAWMDTPSETSSSPPLCPLFLSPPYFTASSSSSSPTLSSLLWDFQSHHAASSKSSFLSTPTGSTDRPRPRRWFTRSSEVTSGREVSMHRTQRKSCCSALLLRPVVWGLPTFDRKCNKGLCLTLQLSVIVLLAETQLVLFLFFPS